MSTSTSQLEALSTKELVETYNKLAAKNKKPAVQKFSDRKTAIRRVAALMSETPAPVVKETPAPVVKEKPERKIRNFRFVFPAEDTIKNVRTGTNRHKLIEVLQTKNSEGKVVGATFDELMAATWGQNKNMSPEIQRKTTYEGLRLLHYWVGYGMRQDEQGRITLFTAAKK